MARPLRIEYAGAVYHVTSRGEVVISKQPKQLQRFVGNPRQNMPDGLPFRLADYLELVDWTGRQIREDKRGQLIAICLAFCNDWILMKSIGCT